MAVAFLAVRAGAPSAASPTRSADARFAVDANAAAAQYCAQSQAGCQGSHGIGATVTVTVGTHGTTAPGGGASSGGGHHGHRGGGHGGSGNGHGGSGNGGSGHGVASGQAVAPGSSPGGSSAAVSQTSVGGADVGRCGSSAYSEQTTQAFRFDGADSGDINLYGDDIGADGVSGTNVLYGSRQAAGTLPLQPGLNRALGNNLNDGYRGFYWNTALNQQSRFVGFCQFWPVDPWGRWGFQLYCNQQAPCHDMAIARSPVAAADGRTMLKPVTAWHRFTIAPYRSALVDLTLTRFGQSLLTRGNGELSGEITAKTIPTRAQPAVLTGTRKFRIYYARCIVWGRRLAVPGSIEATFASSSIGRAFGTRGLRLLQPNVPVTGSCTGLSG